MFHNIDFSTHNQLKWGKSWACVKELPVHVIALKGNAIKLNVGSDREMVQSERSSHSKIQGVDNHELIVRNNIVSRE